MTRPAVDIPPRKEEQPNKDLSNVGPNKNGKRREKMESIYQRDQSPRSRVLQREEQNLEKQTGRRDWQPKKENRLPEQESIKGKRGNHEER